jgi:hypothetical protein
VNSETPLTIDGETESLDDGGKSWDLLDYLLKTDDPYFNSCHSLSDAFQSWQTTQVLLDPAKKQQMSRV